jgi:L-methionine (R)-S-oxide reductase
VSVDEPPTDGEFLLTAAAEVVSSSGDRDERARRIAALIRAAGGYRWVGLYDVLPDEIAVIAWDGPSAPTYPRFPRSQGLCGAAVASRQTVVVGDVRSDPRYLTTHSTTQSEIVVPVMDAADVIGLIDVESAEPDAFGAHDRERLERWATRLAPLWESGPEAASVD